MVRIAVEGVLGHMKHLDLYQVETPDHTIIVHATDPDDALYCAQEGWPDITPDGAHISFVDNPKDYADLEIGVMRDVK